MILLANEQDIPALVGLWEEAFGEDELVRDFYDKAFMEMSVLIVKNEQRIVSMLHYMPCRYEEGGVVYKGVYLYALATDKEYRGRGYMGRLINEALELAKQSGVDFCFLVPADAPLYDFYKKFGFDTMLYKADECNLHFSQIIEEYVRCEIKAYGHPDNDANGPCGVAFVLNPAVKIDKINGLVPF